jgi:ATP-binding cassette subfamily B protein
MNYNLNQESGQKEKKSLLVAVKSLIALMKDEKKILILAFIAIFFNACINLLGPFLIGHTIDNYVQTKQYHGVLVFSGILFCMYLIALVTSYLQTKLMGTVGQRMLFNLRNAVFQKLEELPVDFFYQNKAGDLISRINNDTDKLNLFFSQSLVQFLSSIFIMTGAAIFLLSINIELGFAALSPAIFLWVFTRLISGWVKQKNALNLKSSGEMSAEIQESLNNFKIIIAFNRRDYFRKRFDEINRQNYKTAVSSGLANTIFTPVFGFTSNIGQLIVIGFGIYLISAGQFTMGLLISFLAYINSFYNPLRQIALIWANFQVAMAGWDRISKILNMETNINIIEDHSIARSSSQLSFVNVSFSYPNGTEVLRNINFELERGKTYAFVGPTGGGKTTTASLIARLYDPTKGTILLDGKDIRSYYPGERSRKVGFILQEPFLFSGTIRDNILYGNNDYVGFTNDELIKVFQDTGLESLLSRFEGGLETNVQASGDGVSLGQKQLIAFMRVVLRKPEILILDEATANIDTVTEQLLESILKKLPATTTRVIIAHRLNTIENADEIFFVNSGKIVRAGSLDDAVGLLLRGKREG